MKRKKAIMFFKKTTCPDLVNEDICLRKKPATTGSLERNRKDEGLQKEARCDSFFQSISSDPGFEVSRSDSLAKKRIRNNLFIWVDVRLPIDRKSVV